MSAIKGLFQTAGHIKNARLATYTHNTNKHKSGPASSARKKPRIFTVSILIHSNTQKMKYPKVRQRAFLTNVTEGFCEFA